MTIDAVSASNSNQVASLGGVAKKDQMGQQQFMQLMIAQLKNQDPNKPMDPAAFLSQLAQFGTVSGIQDMQGSLTTLSDSLRSSQVIGGTSMVGHTVLADATDADLNSGGSIAGTTTVPDGASSVSIVITDSSGQQVRSMPLSTQSGESGFLWDGTTDLGTAAPAGTYHIAALANVGGTSQALTTQLVGRVGSVTIDPTNFALTLNTDLGPIPLANVRRVM